MYVVEGLSTRKIAEKIGSTKTRVTTMLKKANIPLRNKSQAVKNIYRDKYQLSEEELRYLYEVKQLSTKEIARKINRSQLYVRKRMKEFGILARESGVAQAMKVGIPVNEKFFDEWSSNMAYVLGFIYADGSLTDYRLTITASLDDSQIIYTIADLISYPRDKIKVRVNKQSNNRYVCLSFSRRYVAKRLNELGVYQNKSKTAQFPNVPKEYMPDFVRGYFDGDGHVTKSHGQIQFGFTCGSIDFIQGLSTILSAVLNKNINIIMDKRGSGNYYLQVHSNRLAKDFYNFIYYSDNVPCLIRKRKKFEEFLCQPCAPSGKECND